MRTPMRYRLTVITTTDIHTVEFTRTSAGAADGVAAITAATPSMGADSMAADFTEEDSTVVGSMAAGSTGVVADTAVVTASYFPVQNAQS